MKQTPAEYHARRAKERLEVESGLTQRQIEIMIGSVLGDATLTKVDKNSRQNSAFVVAHSEKQKGYVKWMHNELRPISKDITMRLSKATTICERATEGGVPTYTVLTQRHSAITKMERKYYKRDDVGEYVYKVSKTKKYRIKVVPPDLVLTPLMVAVWFFDDGCIRVPERNLWLCTMSFTWEECEFLAEKLRGLNITDCWVEWKKKKKKQHPVIHIGCRSFLDFVDMVKQYLPCDDLAYKVDISNYTEPQFFKLRESDKTEIIRMSDDGDNCTRISKSTGFTVTTVSTVLKKHKNIKGRINNSSGIVGVGKQGRRWKAEITVKGKYLHLGNYKQKDHAIAIRKEAEALRAFGEDVNNYHELLDKYAEFRASLGRPKVI